MKIQSILPVKTFRNNYSNNQITLKPNLTLPNDSVCFCAKAKKNNEDFSQKAAKVGREIYNLLLTDTNQGEIYKFIHSKAPNATIRDISHLKEMHIDSEAFAAYFAMKIDDNLHPKDMEFYLRNEIPNSKTQKMTRAMDIAHEYTHYLQASSGADRNRNKKITNDPIYLGLIMGVGDRIFSVFDGKIKADILHDIIIDAVDFRTMSIVPKVKYVDKQSVLKGAKVKDEAEFKEIMVALFNDICTSGLIELAKNPQRIAPQYQEMFYEIMDSSEKIEKLTQDIKTYCSYNAIRERQALKTESILAKQILKTDESLNYDANYIYHELLEKAFT